MGVIIFNVEGADLSYENGKLIGITYDRSVGGRQSHLQIGSLDIVNLDSIQRLTADEVHGLLKDDKLVTQSQSISSSDDVRFSVWASQLNYISVTDKTPLTQADWTHSTTDASGKITVAVPQSNGTKKVYDVKINDQGIVTLELQQTSITQAELWNQVVQLEDIYEGIVETKLETVTFQEAQALAAQYKKSALSLRAEAVGLGYQAIVSRIDLNLEGESLVLDILRLWIMIRDNFESIKTISVSDINQKLTEFRQLSNAQRAKLPQLPQDPIFVNDDREFLQSLFDAEDGIEKIVVGVEYAHLYDPFEPESLPLDVAKAYLATFKTRFEELKTKAIQWGVYQAMFQEAGIEADAAQFIAETEAAIRAAGG